MRVSTGMIFNSAVTAINRQSADLLRTQQQLATGRRILTPADDPVASAAALETSQFVDITDQHAKSQNSAYSSLALAETQLQSATELTNRLRTLLVSVDNPALNDTDRQAIAGQLRAGFDQMMDIANSRDASGLYLFSGYKGESRPFSGSADTVVTYAGDDGQRLLQVSPSLQMPISASGNDVFNRIPSGNGIFATAAAAGNRGTGVIDLGSISDPVRWKNPANGGQLEVSFWIDPATSKTYYDLVDKGTQPPTSMLSGTPSIMGGVGSTHTREFHSGASIDFSGLAAPYDNLGASVTIKGEPRSGDTFSVNSSTQQSVFKTLADMIKVLEQPLNNFPQGKIQLSNQVASTLNNLDQAMQTMLTTRSGAGARMAQVDDLRDVNSAMSVQYKQVLSDLQDVDVAKAISDLARDSTQLQAAQQSFAKVSGLSLFNYI